MVQVYEGLVYMNLSTELLKSRGFGEYENIDIQLQELPQFFLVYLADPSDSGKIHNDVKMRWLNGDQQVVDAMNQVCARPCGLRGACLTGTAKHLAALTHTSPASECVHRAMHHCVRFGCLRPLSVSLLSTPSRQRRPFLHGTGAALAI